MKTITKLWIFLAILIILTPLGIIIPAYFKSGPAWGEWGVEEIEKLAGYIPRGLAKISSLWNAPMQGYSDLLNRGGCGGYVISAVIGVLGIAGIVYLIGRFLTRGPGGQ